MPTIGGMWISWWVSVGPSGPGQGGCMSVDVYINIVHIVPTLGGVICKLLFSLVLSISCQQLGECG